MRALMATDSTKVTGTRQGSAKREIAPAGIHPVAPTRFRKVRGSSPLAGSKPQSGQVYSSVTLEKLERPRQPDH